MYEHSIGDRHNKAEQWKKLKMFQLMILEKLDIHKGKLELISYLIQYTNNYYGQIKKLNVKDKPIKIL